MMILTNQDREEQMGPVILSLVGKNHHRALIGVVRVIRPR